MARSVIPADSKIGTFGTYKALINFDALHRKLKPIEWSPCFKLSRRGSFILLLWDLFTDFCCGFHWPIEIRSLSRDFFKMWST
jgi:hypothetical protein